MTVPTITGHEDHDIPWRMPIVVLVTPDTTHEDAVHAAAQALLALLARTDEPTVTALRIWNDGRIGKLVRRTKSVTQYERALATNLPYEDVTVGTARVAVFAPTPADQTPPEITRFQVSGLDLPHNPTLLPVNPEHPVVYLTPDVDMTSGKAIAQALHAVQLLSYETTDMDLLANTQIAQASPAVWEAVMPFATVTIHDAGFTEIPAGSLTAIGILPTTAD